MFTNKYTQSEHIKELFLIWFVMTVGLWLCLIKENFVTVRDMFWGIFQRSDSMSWICFLKIPGKKKNSEWMDMKWELRLVVAVVGDRYLGFHWTIISTNLFMSEILYKI